MRSYFLTMCPWVLLFSFQSDRHLTRLVVVHVLRDAAHYTGLPYKSLKVIVVASVLPLQQLLLVLSDWLREVLGRWYSDCYQLYIHTPQNVLLSAAPHMASVLFS